MTLKNNERLNIKNAVDGSPIRTSARQKHGANSVRTFLRSNSEIDRSDTLSRDWNKISTPRTADEGAPIIVRDGAGILTLGIILDISPGTPARFP